jgi:ribonuclease P/MRP protein subunit RPP1
VFQRLRPCVLAENFSETRRTYRAVFSEPRLVIPESSNQTPATPSIPIKATSTTDAVDLAPRAAPPSRKRALEDTIADDIRDSDLADKQGASKKKKQKKNRHRKADVAP